MTEFFAQSLCWSSQSEWFNDEDDDSPVSIHAAPRGTNDENGTGGDRREAFGVRELAPAFLRPGPTESAGKPPHSKRFALSGPVSIFGSASMPQATPQMRKMRCAPAGAKRLGLRQSSGAFPAARSQKRQGTAALQDASRTCTQSSFSDQSYPCFIGVSSVAKLHFWVNPEAPRTGGRRRRFRRRW